MSTEQTESTTQLPAVKPGEQPPTGGQPPAGGVPPVGPPEQPAEWGAPPSPAAAPRSKWTAKRIVIAAVVAVGIAAAGGAAIYAASGSVDNSQGPGGGPGGANGGPGGGRMMGGPMMSFQDTQHGEFQTGEITALSDDSVTVKSEDGYEQTYAITSDTQKTDGIAKGDEVTVIATTENDKATATSILQFSAMSNRQNGNGGGPNGGTGQFPSGGNAPNGGN